MSGRVARERTATTTAAAAIAAGVANVTAFRAVAVAA
jgi:hypothetical protein